MKIFNPMITRLWICGAMPIALSFVFISTPCFALNILTFGDSITQGYQRAADGFVWGITSPVNGAANIGGYQPVLNQLLDDNLQPSTVYNWGVGGETSYSAVKRIGSVLDSRQADYILILSGANDLYQGISSNTTKANLRSMIDQSRTRNVQPIISELSPNNYYTTSITYDYNPKITNLADEKGVPIVLMFQEMWPGWNRIPYNSGDGLHVSDIGYEKMANLWYAILKEENPPNTMPAINLLLLK